MNVDCGITSSADDQKPLPRTGRNGMTLVEVMIAMFLLAIVAGGLYAVGIKSRQLAEQNRLATEARALAKERLEEIIALGFEGLTRPTCTLWHTDTNYSAQGHRIVRQPTAIWHAADGSIASPTNASYVEAHVAVRYLLPLTSKQQVDSYSTIVHQ